MVEATPPAAARRKLRRPRRPEVEADQPRHGSGHASGQEAPWSSGTGAEKAAEFAPVRATSGVLHKMTPPLDARTRAEATPLLTRWLMAQRWPSPRDQQRAPRLGDSATTSIHLDRLERLQGSG